MYEQGSADYKSHIAEYGHPSTNGFKDVIHEWKAENFDPDKLLKFYKDNGAKIFHGARRPPRQLRNFNSKYQPWNSVAIGPHKDLIGGWAAAARKNGLRFARERSRFARLDRGMNRRKARTKPGRSRACLTTASSPRPMAKGLWWDGLDPQDLYAQNHAPGKGYNWDWDLPRAAAFPTRPTWKNFSSARKQLWDDYHPDQIYFDDSVLPFHGVTDEVGLNLAAHFYNSSITVARPQRGGDERQDAERHAAPRDGL